MVERDLDLTAALVEPCIIETEDAKPVKCKPYKMAHKLQEVLRKEIKDMLSAGVIRRSHSPWAAPILFVAKKDGSQRMCIDYRKLNNLTVQNSYPLPSIDNMLNRMNGATVFSTFDLKAGYWQVKLSESSRHKSAFICEEGLFEFNRMPFGLTCAPSIFQEIMNNVLGDNRFHFCQVYLDGIIIYRTTCVI